MKASAVLLFSAVLGACCMLAAANEPATWATAHCECSRERAIVCGADNTSYLNKCWAECSGTTVEHEGPCGKLDADVSACDCPKERALVCGADGHTYLNECWAACVDTDVIHQGPCTRALEHPPCACTKERDLVCGADGHTYLNACWAACSGTSVTHDGACTKLSAEEAVSDSCDDSCDKSGFARPVCGTDGKDYPSECAANCAGAEAAFNYFCKPCPIPRIYAPVCDTRGYTWTNEYELKCGGGEKAKDGPCGDFDEGLLAIAEVEESVTSSECQKACPRVLAPVCGMNDKSYANECRMECDGVELKHEGRCAIAVVKNREDEFLEGLRPL